MEITIPYNNQNDKHVMNRKEAYLKTASIHEKEYLTITHHIECSHMYYMYR